MNSQPKWLPAIIPISGDWNKVLKQLYQIFDRDFRQTVCCFEGRDVFWDRRKIDSPYEEGFWHLITKFDYHQNGRLVDPRRAERLPWCRATIVNSAEPEVKVWRYKEGSNRTRAYLWIEDWDYVIVLEERKHGAKAIAFLVTAFHVDGNSTRKNLQKKYAKRVQ